MPQYLVGLGSNIEPQHNMLRMVEVLAARYPSLYLSPVIVTQPVAMLPGCGEFYNAVVYFSSEQTPAQLKRDFNAIEEALGRDRSDPQSKVKNRPADLDILAYCDQGWPEQPIEPYFSALADILLAFIQSTPQPQLEYPAVSLSFGGHLFGQRATAIHR